MNGVGFFEEWNFPQLPRGGQSSADSHVLLSGAFNRDIPIMANFVVTVRYGLMATTERFTCETDDVRIGDQVIVRTGRGIDFGEAMSRARPSGESDQTQGELLRPANKDDLRIFDHIRDSREPEEFETCQACIAERELPMRLVGVEHLFSGDKIIFYFLADNRVDFRELVKELARRYRTRIEMRQIGVRDEARLLADYEHCGRELCCRTFIRNLEPVTMRMAKMQKTTLDPSKISGHCGRLMCCLRFEDDVYSTLQSELPAKGAVCVTERFTGEVTSVDMFRQEILLTLFDGSQETVHVSEIKEIQGRRPGRGNTIVNPSGGLPGPGAPSGPGRSSGRFRNGGDTSSGGEGARSTTSVRRERRPTGRGGRPEGERKRRDTGSGNQTGEAGERGREGLARPAPETGATAKTENGAEPSGDTVRTTPAPGPVNRAEPGGEARTGSGDATAPEIPEEKKD